MITPKEREELKEILPYGYAKEICRRLNNAGICPIRATIYKPQIIREVFSGRVDDMNVELQLFRYRDEILSKKAELEKLRNKRYGQNEESDG